MKAHYLAITLNGIQQNNFQAFLAVLGVTVGVAALIVSLGLARGADSPSVIKCWLLEPA